MNSAIVAGYGVILAKTGAGWSSADPNYAGSGSRIVDYPVGLWVRHTGGHSSPETCDLSRSCQIEPTDLCRLEANHDAQEMRREILHFVQDDRFSLSLYRASTVKSRQGIAVARFHSPLDAP